MVSLVPVNAPVVPVTVVSVPTSVSVVNTVVARPLASVRLVRGTNDPPSSVFVQVTTLPAVLTGLPVASASWALIVTSSPAMGV